MFSWEISKLLAERNYNIDSETYMKICMSSPQICSVSYKPYGDYFEMIDDKHNYWKFNVYRKEE